MGSFSDEDFGAADARGRTAWPELHLTPDVFRAYVLERVAKAAPTLSLAALHADALYLACACARGDDAAIAAFRRTFGPHVVSAARRVRVDDAVVDEIVQIVMTRLLVRTEERPPLIVEYGGRGDLSRWVRAVTTRAVVDHQRASGRETPTAEEQLALHALPSNDPEIDHIREKYAGELGVAVRDAFAELDGTARNDLRHYYIDGLNLEELAALRKVSAATMSRRLSRTREQVLDRTRAILSLRLSLPPRDVESILGVMGSRLDAGTSLLSAKT